MAAAAAGGYGGSGRRQCRRLEEVAEAASGYGGSGRRRCRRLAEAAVDGPVAMTAVMDAMNGCMRPANAAMESSTARFASASELSSTHLISVFVALSSDVGLINCSYPLYVDVVRLRGKAMMG